MSHATGNGSKEVLQELTDAQPRGPPSSAITPTQKEIAEPAGPIDVPDTETPDQDQGEEHLESVSEAAPTSSGNPYWKNLGCTSICV